MDFDDIINSMMFEVYQCLLIVVELGKWFDGVVLIEE